MVSARQGAPSRVALGLGTQPRPPVTADVVEGVHLHVPVPGYDDALVGDGADNVIAGLGKVAGVGDK